MKKTLLAGSLLCAAFSIQAQQAIPSSGGNATGSGGTSSYSVGQLAYHTDSGSGGSSSQGVSKALKYLHLVIQS